MAFGFTVLLWMGAALMVAALLPERRVPVAAVRWTIALLVGHAAGAALSLVLGGGSSLTVTLLVAMLVVELALAGLVAWRACVVTLGLVVAIEGLLLVDTLASVAHGTSTPLLVHAAWRAAIVAAAVLAIVQLRRRRAVV